MVERTMSLGVGGDNGEFSGVRETMRAQQELLQKINQELDAEREASSSAASEALSMILRLQGEKAALELEASQYKRMAEEKMCYAETSLALFEDLIYHKEMEIASLGFQVQAYRCKLLSYGCTDPAVIDNKFPENLISYGENSQKRKMKRNLSSPFDGVSTETSLPLSPVNGESFEEKKTPLESSISPRGDLNGYWEQIRRIDEHVKEISDSRDVQKEPKFPLIRRESLSQLLVSQVSNTILESAKSDVNSIMEIVKNPEKYSGETPILSPKKSPTLSPKKVQGIFEIPRSKENLTIISEGEQPAERNVRGKMISNYERLMSKPPRDTSIKGEHLSLLKEIREQLNVMQTEMRSLRSELHQPKPVSHRKEDNRALNSLQEAMIHFWL